MINEPVKNLSKRNALRTAAMAIKQRCTNSNHHSYKNYGGRGIKLCDAWFNNYPEMEKYCLDNGWYEGCQIDRINNDGNYEPGNIRFVSASTNQQNRRYNKFSQQDIIDIKTLRASGLTMQAIADKYKSNSGSISKICSGDIWKGTGEPIAPENGFNKFNNMGQKFSYQQVMDLLKSHHDDKTPIKRLARQQGVAAGSMRKLLRGETWKEAHTDFFSKRQPIA